MDEDKALRVEGCADDADLADELVQTGCRLRAASGGGSGLKVFVHGEYWDADSDEPLAVGDAVEVISVDGLRVRVRRRRV